MSGVAAQGGLSKLISGNWQMAIALKSFEINK